MKNICGIIYDCDGVLFDSRRANLAYYGKVLSYFGELPLLDEDSPRADLCHTHASLDVFHKLLGPARVSEAQTFAETIDIHSLFPLMIPEKGIPQVLDRLSKRMVLALATNRGRSVCAILDHFHMRNYFKAVVTSEDVQRPKPSPDMLLLAVDKLGLKPEQVLFVGDSELDRQAARQAGLRFVAYKGWVDGDLIIHEHQELETLLGVA
jgi:HAD superfamily hydrolase (TIGR01509 family)